MASTDTLTYIRLQEIPSGQVEIFKVEPGATFRNVLWSCFFVKNPERCQIVYWDQHGAMKQPSIDEQAVAHVYEHDQEFLVYPIDGCGPVIISHS